MTDFVRVSRPWTAWVQADAAEPARYLMQMAGHTLNYGMPARRRGGRALTVLGRRPLPVHVVGDALRRLPAHPEPELSTLAERVREHWPLLAAESRRLPAQAPRLSMMALQRRAGRFVFVFGEGRSPLLVLKPAPPHGTVDPEAAALDLVRDLAIGPRMLPPLPGLLIQEGLPGRPQWVVAPGARGWSRAYLRPYEDLGAALVDLARATRGPGRPPGIDHIDAALGLVGGRTADKLGVVRRDLVGFDGVTLEHHDLSAQNWLVDRGRLSGLVDWEAAVTTGMPGYDAIHSAVALLEHGVALRSWSQHHVLRAFTDAWHDEPLFARARHWHGECVRAATGSDALAQQLLIAYFASRLGRRVNGGGPALLEVDTVLAMLDVVVGSEH